MALILGARLHSPLPPASAPAPGSGDNAAPAAAPARFEDAWTARWQALTTLAGSASRDAEMAGLLATLAQTDPLRALALAGQEPDPGLRDVLQQAALRGWGTRAPAAAIRWARTQGQMDFSQAVASIFKGAVHDPENALQLAGTCSAEDPDHARDYGLYAIAALIGTDRSNQAAAFAAAAPESTRPDLLNAAYDGWARSDPRAAADSALRLPDSATGTAAFNAVVSRWAADQPQALAEYAVNLPSAEQRSFALSAALRQWTAENPADAATWLARFAPSPELDLAAAAVASNPQALQDPPTAAAWANTITDRSLRARVRATIVNQWAIVDAAAACHYVESLGDVPPEERAVLLSAFTPDFNPVSFLP